MVLLIVIAGIKKLLKGKNIFDGNMKKANCILGSKSVLSL